MTSPVRDEAVSVGILQSDGATLALANENGTSDLELEEEHGLDDCGYLPQMGASDDHEQLQMGAPHADAESEDANASDPSPHGHHQTGGSRDRGSDGEVNENAHAGLQTGGAVQK